MTLASLFNRSEFIARHIGPSDAERSEMLAEIGAASLDDLVAQTLPADIRLNRALDLRPRCRKPKPWPR